MNEQNNRNQGEESHGFNLDGASEFFGRIAGSESAKKLGTSRKMVAAIQEEAREREEEAKKEKHGRRVYLECTDVVKQYKQYDSVVTAVNRATFSVLENEFVAIIGASGSGKSTLLHLCAGLDRPKAQTADDAVDRQYARTRSADGRSPHIRIRACCTSESGSEYSPSR